MGTRLSEKWHRHFRDKEAVVRTSSCHGQRSLRDRHRSGCRLAFGMAHLVVTAGAAASLAVALALTLPVAAPVRPGAKAEPAVGRAPFGTLEDGSRVTLYTLTNLSGIEVKIINLGATVVSLKVPDREGARR